MRSWNSTSHIDNASTMRIANAIPASVVVAASIDPNDDQGLLPLTSDATTSSCRNPSAAVANSERLRMRRSIGWLPAPDQTYALVRRIPTMAMIARYEA